jgi:hypothetical protein
LGVKPARMRVLTTMARHDLPTACALGFHAGAARLTSARHDPAVTILSDVQ